jgi:hypothetical protein
MVGHRGHGHLSASLLPQLFWRSERFSSNNAGYVVLGRIIEVLRGKP